MNIENAEIVTLIFVSLGRPPKHGSLSRKITWSWFHAADGTCIQTIYGQMPTHKDRSLLKVSAPNMNAYRSVPGFYLGVRRPQTASTYLNYLKATNLPSGPEWFWTFETILRIDRYRFFYDYIYKIYAQKNCVSLDEWLDIDLHNSLFEFRWNIMVVAPATSCWLTTLSKSLVIICQIATSSYLADTIGFVNWFREGIYITYSCTLLGDHLGN